MLGGSASTYWEQKWLQNEPSPGDDGYVFFSGVSDALVAVGIGAVRMPRAELVCMQPVDADVALL